MCALETLEKLREIQQICTRDPRRHQTQTLNIWHAHCDKSESGKGGWKFGVKPLPKNVFGPPTYDTFPPFFWRLSVISLKRKRHRPDQPQFLRPPEVVLESTLCSTFPTPQIHVIRFAPPPQPLNKHWTRILKEMSGVQSLAVLELVVAVVCMPRNYRDRIFTTSQLHRQFLTELFSNYNYRKADVFELFPTTVTGNGLSEIFCMQRFQHPR